MDAKTVGRVDLPPLAISVLELVSRGFDVTRGPVTIELVYQDGMVQSVYLKQKLGLSLVREFDASFAEAWRTLIASSSD